MAQNKHKTKRRIISILCVTIIALYALTIPTYAIISVSRGEGNDYTMSASSSFPMTLGFVYRSSPVSTYSYTLCTDIGGYGQEFPRTDYGEDVVTHENDELGTSIEVIRKINYQFQTPFVVSNGNYINAINGNKLGYYPMLIGSQTPDNPTQEASSIIIKASDIVYNRAWLDLYESSGETLNLAEHAYFGIPTLKLNDLVTGSTTEKLVGRINIQYYIQGSNGVKERVAYSYTVDTSLSNNNILLLNIDNLLSYDVLKNPRLLITDYECYIDVDYYEYVEAEVTDELAGTWVFNDNVDTTTSTWCGGEFVSNNYTYYQLLVNDANYGNNLIIYIYDTDDYRGSTAYNNGWSNTNFKTITFASEPSAKASNFSSWLQANATKQGSTGTVAEEGTWEKVESNIPNTIYLTMPTYDTSGAYNSDGAQINAQNIYFSFPDTNSYVDGIERLSFEDVDLTSWLANATKGFLDFQLWENFTIGGVLAILVTIPLMIWVLKLFAGG